MAFEDSAALAKKDAATSLGSHEDVPDRTPRLHRLSYGFSSGYLDAPVVEDLAMQQGPAREPQKERYLI